MPGRMRRVFCVLFALNVISGCSAGQLFVPLEGSAGYRVPTGFGSRCGLGRSPVLRSGRCTRKEVRAG